MKRVNAIRAHKAVGRGSCSSLDECFSDKDLIELLDEAGIAEDDAAGAIRWAIDSEGLFLEQGLNQRWGDDDDIQLKVYNEFKTLCEES